MSYKIREKMENIELTYQDAVGIVENQKNYERSLDLKDEICKKYKLDAFDYEDLYCIAKFFLEGRYHERKS